MQSRKKICFIVASPLTATSFLLKHFEYLSKHFDVYLVANFTNYENLQNSIPNSIEAKHIAIERNISIIKDIKVLFTLKNFLKSHNFNAIHTISPKAGLIGILAGNLAGIKIRTHIFTGQIWHTKKGLFKLVLKNIDRFIVLLSTNILVDGQSQRQFLISNKIIKSINSSVLGKGSISGVDVEKFIPNPNIKNKYRNDLKITDEVVFLFLGRLNHDKGILDLVHAFVKINIEFPQTKLVLVGPDEEDMLPKIQNITRGNTSIIVYGATSKPQDVLQMADVFCLPSYREGFGTSVIEASLLEIPIIASDTYGLQETMLENETGLRHHVADIKSLQMEMIKMMNPDLRKSLGTRGRSYVLENFPADKISQEWLTYYTKLLS